MSQAVYLEVFYPHPPERVWQVLTDRRALATWMMENNFEPKLGHKFQFYSNPLPGLKTTIQCEVVELEQPTRLVYTWQESPSTEPSLVVWTLTTVPGGTQLRLKHHQYSYATAVATLSRCGTTSVKRYSVGKAALDGLTSSHFHDSSKLFLAEQFANPTELATLSCYSNLRNKPQFSTASKSTTLEFPKFQTFTWNYFLNQTLPKALGQDEPTCS